MTEETQKEEVATSETAGTTSVALPVFYGLKAGMTRIFDDKGNHISVTVVKIVPNHITQVKTTDKDGYEAYQIGYYEKREKLVNKPTKGHLAKAGAGKFLARFSEVKMEGADTAHLGKAISLEDFPANTTIDVQGVTKGKGFQGVIKRHNFAGGPAAHGSHFHRHGGSIGNRATPGRVFKLKKMPGQMGNKVQTVQNLSIVEVNTEKGYLLIKGSVPGSRNNFVRISKAIKSK